MDEKTVSQVEAARASTVSRWRLADVVAGGAFFAVEIGAELIRRRLVGTASGILSTPAAALLGTTLWTYLAHTRYAFRASLQTGLATLPPYVVLCLCLTIVTSWLGRGGSGSTEVALFAAATTLKFALLSLWLWPLGTDRRAGAA